MAMTTCKNCGKSVSDKAKNCPSCGFKVSKESKRRYCKECGAEITENEKACTNCGCPVVNKRILSSRKILAILGSAVALILVAIVVIWFAGKADRVIAEAKGLAEKGLYTDAIAKLDSLENPEKTALALGEMYVQIEDDVCGLLEAGKYSEARKMVEEFSNLPAGNVNNIFLRVETKVYDLMSAGKYTEAQKMVEEFSNLPEESANNIFLRVEAEVYSLMSAGDYIEAQTVLDLFSVGAIHKELQEKIMFESIALTCIKNLKPVMKNPQSLQINSIEFYYWPEKTKYPSVIILSSGQNGFGGYSTSFSVYNEKDLALIGTCSSLDEDDYNAKSSDVDELYELLMCKWINSRRKNGSACGNCDISRINLLLSGNVELRIDVEKYASEVDANESADDV